MNLLATKNRNHVSSCLPPPPWIPRRWSTNLGKHISIPETEASFQLQENKSRSCQYFKRKISKPFPKETVKENSKISSPIPIGLKSGQMFQVDQATILLTKNKETGLGRISVVQLLPNMLKALGSIPAPK
jgi:hypothetical protein